MKPIRFAVTLGLALMAASLGRAESEGKGVSTSNAWDLLREGNERFARGISANPHSSKEQRNAVIEAQRPFAVVLGCSDSRVPLERVLDAGIGDLYTVRVGGNAASEPGVVGSLEYGALHTSAKLVAVIGHEGCNELKAAVDGHREAGSSVGAMLAPLKAAASNATDAIHDLKGHENVLSEAVERNVLVSMRDLIMHSPRIAERLKSGELKMVGGVYSMHTGRIRWLGEHPSERELCDASLTAEKNKK
jgi:carbonic anhydrase